MIASTVSTTNLRNGILAMPAGIDIACLTTGIKRAEKTTPYRTFETSFLTCQCDAF